MFYSHVLAVFHAKKKEKFLRFFSKNYCLKINFWLVLKQSGKKWGKVVNFETSFLTFVYFKFYRKADHSCSTVNTIAS
jgi:hypothetical protein